MTARPPEIPRRKRTFIPPARETRRLLSMLMLLVLLGVMIAHTSRPETWAWLAENQANGAPEIPPANSVPDIPQVEEVLVPNPTDEDPEELAAVKELFRNVRDKIPFQLEEMPPYWRLFKWARAQTMESLEARSQKAPFFTQFWDDPDSVRGKLFTLRLHVRRVLSHEAPENSAGVTRVYELWGVTDESRGHPYVVITSDLPPSIPEGANVRAEAVFSGYFLKLLGYEASDARRGSPLLIGKVRALPQPPSLLKDPQKGRAEFWQGILTGGIILILFVGAAFFFRPRKSRIRQRLEASIETDAENWLANPPAGSGTSTSSAKESSPSPFPDFSQTTDDDANDPEKKPPQL